MNIKEIITEEVVDEYRIIGKVDPSDHIKTGNSLKHRLRVVNNTPVSDLFNVRYNNHIRSWHEYYLYDKNDECVGYFGIEMVNMVDFSFNNVLKLGVKAVIPHIALATSIQGQGIASKIYTSFLRGGKWVFATLEHSADAAKLWKRIATGDITIVYVDSSGNRIEKPRRPGDAAMIGPKDRFL